MDLMRALKEELTLPLPGLDYQLKMAPERRDIIFNNKIKQNAAVAIITSLSIKNEWEIILTKRAEYDGHHSRQVSFPGGKEEPGDEDLMHTAIRETYEEIGLQLTNEHYIGSLTPLFIPVSQFMVFPYVFLKPIISNYTLDKSEVDYIIHYPLRNLQDNSLIKSTTFQISNRIITTPYYAIMEEIVWGATAMILSEFIEIVKRVQIKNPGLF
jgi:8-oxo-dGTP pyrophosphatase MutT (NUDIX family)